ncbi:MAG: hypothetical protein ACR2IJ_07300 [Fluviibacter sp.]
MSRKVYAAKLAVVEQDRVITVLSIGPFPEWTKLLRQFTDTLYQEAPAHQWSVLVDASPEGDGNSRKQKELEQERNVLWMPVYYKAIQDLLSDSNANASSASASDS